MLHPPNCILSKIEKRPPNPTNLMKNPPASFELGRCFNHCGRLLHVATCEAIVHQYVQLAGRGVAGCSKPAHDVAVRQHEHQHKHKHHARIVIIIIIITIVIRILTVMMSRSSSALSWTSSLRHRRPLRRPHYRRRVVVVTFITTLSVETSAGSPVSIACLLLFSYHLAVAILITFFGHVCKLKCLLRGPSLPKLSQPFALSQTMNKYSFEYGSNESTTAGLQKDRRLSLQSLHICHTLRC